MPHKTKFLIFFIIIIFQLISWTAGENGDYVGAGVCGECHQEIYQSWMGTKHASAFEDLENSGRSQDYCYVCHTTGVDANGNWVFEDIQCESCHGGGKSHTESGGNASKIVLSWDAIQCGTCHSQSHFPQYDEWNQSKHATSLLASGGEVVSRQECRSCHVFQVIVKEKFEGKNIPEEEISRILEDPNPVNCQTCHDPHGSQFIRDMRLPPVSLCKQCHNSDNSSISDEILHPQSDMYKGSFWEKNNISCYNCHRYVKVFESDISPAITGHTFQPRAEQCLSCHEDRPLSWAKDYIDSIQQQTILLISAAYEANGRANSLIKRAYPEWNDSGTVDSESPYSRSLEKYYLGLHYIKFVEEDLSKGFHNFEKAREYLTLSINQSRESMELLPTDREMTSVHKIPSEIDRVTFGDQEPVEKGICGPGPALLISILPMVLYRLFNLKRRKLG